LLGGIVIWEDLKMVMHNKVKSGFVGLDQVIDYLRLGDNVVWQVDSIDDYALMAEAFVEQAIAEQRKIIYFRFGDHRPLIDLRPEVKVYQIDPSKRFESFTTEIYKVIEKEGEKVLYVFDCLTDLLQYWYSDLMIGNFFKVICPFLYELDTVAYFALLRNVHTFNTIAGIRETTQVLLDLYRVKENLYVHPLKVWQRYSPTMFFPHRLRGQEAESITSSSEAAELFAAINRSGSQLDYWHVVLNKAEAALNAPMAEQEKIKKLLMYRLIGKHSGMFDLCVKYFSLRDILNIAYREIGTGFIGGKSIGMLLARKIIEKEGKNNLVSYLEPHDSWYIGSDVFYTYIVQNGWWKLRTKQKTKEGFYKYAPELKEKILHGKFPKDIQEQFILLLEYFGQSPIIVRSSSLLEDNFGNAFAGKYESVFCANQGTPEERYEAFEKAVRTVYASTMDEDALAYRMERGLYNKDEQMAILVQRVSGDNYGDNFFPHIAGVGNSINLYVFDKNTDMNAGMLRLVFGLGTRAVNRTVDDYAKMVCLDNPLRLPPMNVEDKSKYSQHQIDLISLKENALVTKRADEILSGDIKIDKKIIASYDHEKAKRLKELGYTNMPTPYIIDFKGLLQDTDFIKTMREILSTLASVYNYPVDIEFAVNFLKGKRYKINLLQCRPLQTKGLGKPVAIPELKDDSDCIFRQKGHFMGGNIRMSIDYVILVNTSVYQKLTEQEKYSVARYIGKLNAALKGKHIMLIGPGRWGTTTPSLGVPVHFNEISNMSVICEVASSESGFMPEVSYGSHFFLDLVETGIFYAAIMADSKDTVYNPHKILELENLLPALLNAEEAQFAGVIHVAKTDGLEIYADIMTQILLCK